MLSVKGYQSLGIKGQKSNIKVYTSYMGQGI